MGRMAKIPEVAWRLAKDFFAFSRAFSPRLAWFRLVCSLSSYLTRLKGVNRRFTERKHAWIIYWLEMKYGSVLGGGDAGGPPVAIGTGKSFDVPPIWVFWWQGEENAPELIRICVDSIRRNADGHEVIFLSQANLGDWLTLPGFILDRLRTGAMTITHFSDVVRFCLLAEYGGLWLDAAIYCSYHIPVDVFTRPLFSCKSEDEASPFISRSRWVTGIFGGRAGHPLFQAVRALYYAYWRAEVAVIDYFLLDYLLSFVYDRVPEAKRDIDAIPENNPKRNLLMDALNEPFDAEKFREITQGDTFFHKISRKYSYAKMTGDGRQTFYGYLTSGSSDRNREGGALQRDATDNTRNCPNEGRQDGR